MTKMTKVPTNRDQGIGLNGTVNNEIVALFTMPIIRTSGAAGGGGVS